MKILSLQNGHKLGGYVMFTLIYAQSIVAPLHAAVHAKPLFSGLHSSTSDAIKNESFLSPDNLVAKSLLSIRFRTLEEAALAKEKFGTNTNTASKTIIPLIDKGKVDFGGGPSSPEATSFKTVGADNLVNLFTGDFSYSIPLLDVGGYPVNLFYSGGVTMEQEASWVGLGWNINPGTVSRNMRGVPDDFNGKDLLKQTQKVKPNRTWGGQVGIDGELLGFDIPKVNFSLGVSHNNYLGPAFDLGASFGLGISITESIVDDKTGTTKKDTTFKKPIGNLDLKLSSRSGLTISPSLNAMLPLVGNKVKVGVGISTDYNSRTGIKELNLQMSSVSVSKESQNKKDANKINLSLSGTISFAKPSYLPTLRMPMAYKNHSGHLEIGAGMFGLKGGVSGLGYYSESAVPAEWQVQSKPLVGYIYSEMANNNKDAVMDINRMNDAEVTPNTPVISAPYYSYDVFSIQGEGTGGMIRAYRSDMGYMRDNETKSKDENISIGADIAPAGHFGVNWSVIKSPTRVGGWNDAKNQLASTISFKPKQAASLTENVYFKNPAELSVNNPELLQRVGADNLVRFKLSGNKSNPTLEPKLEMFDKKMSQNSKGEQTISNSGLTDRDKRTQVISILTAKEAAEVGLEKRIRNYSGNFGVGNLIQYDNIARDSGHRKSHHISEISVLEQSGMRYVYGIPVYNLVQKDFTFSSGIQGDPQTGLTLFQGAEPTLSSPHMLNKSNIDGYLSIQETPAYASSFLLNGLLSPDYVDLTGDGITEDDLGNAVKFDYKKSGTHKWRTPRNNSSGNSAHFNEGLKSIKKDNKANISYGEREVWYLTAIESKSMIAIFHTSIREDAKGVIGEMDGRVNVNEDANKKLEKIDLYTKSEINSKGINNAIPIKTVHFKYSYKLCQGTPDNKNSTGTQRGKLTLDSVYFTYYGRDRANKDKYVFSYQYNSSTAATDNPSYAYQSSDRWGTYKPASGNPSSLTNADFPYTPNNKTVADTYAGAWSLKKILLPSGGQMEIQYEADDYGYVQNRKASSMFEIYGFGKNENFTTSNALYSKPFLGSGLLADDNDYVYIKVSEPIIATTQSGQKKEIADKYLQDLLDEQLLFKLFLDVPKGNEFLNVYAKFTDYGLCPHGTIKDIIYFKLKKVDNKSPLSRATIGFLVENLYGQAFPNAELEINGIKDFLGVVVNLLLDIKNVFKNVDLQMREKGRARTIGLSKSFVRLASPNRTKIGGGVRVKRVLVRDNWNKMTNLYTSTYGQDYDYTTTERIAGIDKVVSSGVASYEPGIGSEENPFREVIAYSDKAPLATAQYGAIEMPILEDLYPSPGVGYGKVTVRSIHRKGTHGDSTLRSAVGKQVTEYYTAKEFPTYSKYTGLNSMSYSFNSLLNYFYKELIERKTVSQGFIVETNDMHGKMRSQSAYSESDEKTPLSYSYYTYKNTGKNGLNDKVDFVQHQQGATVTKGNMGIDVELMTDVREFKIATNGKNGQLQKDFFNFVPFPIFAIPKLFLQTNTENRYRAVTTTKLINYHAIEDSVIVMDKGSVVSTKTIAYDAETGLGLVSKTLNEFDDPIYNTNYPAYWAYSGMGLAYKNIDREFKNVGFNNGKILLPLNDQNEFFESGDELYLYNPGTGRPGVSCADESGAVKKLWVFDKGKDTTALTNTNKDLYFIDEKGRFYTKAGVDFRIIRSGKRNLLGNSVVTATSMSSPIIAGKLVLNNLSNVIASTAIDYKEKWQQDAEFFPKYSEVYNPSLCSYETVLDCINGKYETSINPYTKGLIGNYKPYRSFVFYGQRAESDPSVESNIRKNGYLTDFGSYWNFDLVNNLRPNLNNNKWVWNTEITKVNARGQELETRNALDIYSSAQFGFSKNLNTAVANNSRAHEMFAESFEDYNYNDHIYAQAPDCEKRKVAFSGAAFGDTRISNIKAHTGNRYMQVNAGGQALVSSSLAPQKDFYNFFFTNDTTKILTDPGSVLTRIQSIPYNADNPVPPDPGCVGVYSFIDADSTFQDNGMCYGIFTQAYIGYTYIEMQNDGFFDIDLHANGADISSTNIYSATSYCEIRDLNGNIIGSDSYAAPYNNGAAFKTFSICLKKGRYKINFSFYGNHSLSTDCGPYGVPVGAFGFGANISYTTPCFKTLSTVNGCQYLKPLEVSDSMFNPVFQPSVGKKMYVSAWVKECATEPCNMLTNGNSKILVDFGGASQTFNITPTGSVIDGWQKVEGAFEIPINATSLNIKFQNTSSNSANYWDDIRVTPFNANMKSYAYDPLNLRLAAEMDENNYATLYEYDEEGQLIRVKKETAAGIKTIQETRSSKQQSIRSIID